MKVVFCAAEAAPLVKVGGLGDVVGSLPKTLQALGIDPILILPRYGCLEPEAFGFVQQALTFTVRCSGKEYTCGVWQGVLPGTNIPTYFIENDTCFGSLEAVYPVVTPEVEVERFVMFSHAVLDLLPLLNLQPDILHLHDWHTAPMAVELVKRQSENVFYQQTRSLLTLHNMAYQGAYGGINWLKEGLTHAHRVSTVSPTYAQEIQTPAYGAQLETVVQQLSPPVVGILNGIDTTLFSPQTDVFLPEPYDISTVKSGKALAKRELQAELGLPLRPDVPLVGLVSRLVEQKGLDLILPVLSVLAKRRAQWIFLGSGEPGYEVVLKELSQQYPNMRSFIGFNVSLAQQLYAGSDFFLMPSHFEPCGLGQMIALRYGSIPIVRATGGLADTVVDVREHPETGTGFLFKDYNATALVDALDDALQAYQDPLLWPRLIQQGMGQDFSWERSAKQYQQLYQEML